MNDCSQPGAGSDAKANLVVVVGVWGGGLSGRWLCNEISCDKGAGGRRPLASALDSWGVPLLVGG